MHTSLLCSQRSNCLPIFIFLWIFITSTMSLCFICNEKLQSERTQVCSSITPHSATPYPEKIAEILGEDFVVIVTPNDQMCMKCTSLLNYLDKSNNDVKLVTNAMLSSIKTKYGILPPDPSVQGVEIVNGQLMTHEQLEQGRRKVSIGVTAGVSSTATTYAIGTPITTPFILLKPQQQQQQRQRQQQQGTTKKILAYKCCFCEFQSKELGHVRCHVRTHKKKIKPKTPIPNQAAANTLTLAQQQKTLLYKCQICYKTFDNQINCLDHIKEEHKKSTTSTSNGARETEGYPDMEGEIKTEKADNGEETKNSQEAIPVKGCEPAREEAAQVGGKDTAMPDLEEADQKTLNSIKKEVIEDDANVEN